MKTTKENVRKHMGRFCVDGRIHFANREIVWVDGSSCGGTIIFTYTDLGNGRIDVGEYGDFLVRGNQTATDEQQNTVRFVDGEVIDGGDLLAFGEEMK